MTKTKINRKGVLGLPSLVPHYGSLTPPSTTSSLGRAGKGNLCLGPGPNPPCGQLKEEKRRSDKQKSVCCCTSQFLPFTPPWRCLGSCFSSLPTPARQQVPSRPPERHQATSP